MSVEPGPDKSISDYELLFEYGIDTPVVRQLFGKFLSKCLVHESLEFYEEVLRFEKTISDMSSHATSSTVDNAANFVSNFLLLGKKKKAHKDNRPSVAGSGAGSVESTGVADAMSPFEQLQRQAESIIDRFVRDGSPSEVNLPSDVKQGTLSAFEHAKTISEDDLTTATWKSIFSEAKHVVTVSLKLDNWPRFVRSRVWLDWIEEKWAKKRHEAIVVLEQAGVSREEREKEVSRVMFTEDELFSSYVLQKDVDFIYQMIQDHSDWELLYADDDGSQGFFSGRQYFKNLSDTKGEWVMVKQVMYLPSNFEHVFAAMNTTAFAKLDPLIYDLSQYAFHPANSEHPYASTIFAARLKTLFFLSDRVIPTASSTFYDRERKSVVCIHRPTLDPSIPRFKKDVIASGWYCYEYAAHGENMCRHMQFYYINLGGWLKNKNKSLFVNVVKKRGVSMTKGMTRIVREYDNKGCFPHTEDIIGVFATLEENCKQLSLPQDQWPSLLQPLNPDQSEEARWYPNRRHPPFSGEHNVKKYGIKKNISHGYRQSNRASK